MKKIIFVILVLNLSFIYPQGWFSQEPPVGVFELNDIFAISPDIAFAVGDSAKIIKTSDGGITWNLIYQKAIKASLNSVFFVDSLYGWTVGGISVLNTTDGGKTWHEYVFNTIFSNYSVYFINRDIGWIAGAQIYKTTDGGSSWNIKTNDAGHNWLRDICFIDSKTGFVAGTYGGWGDTPNGIFLSSSDGGETWTSKKTNDLYSICFNSNYGWMVGSVGNNTLFYFTNDKGVNWESTLMEGDVFSTVCFADENNGWLAGKNILYTTDGGVSWNKQETDYHGTNITLNSVSFANDKIGWTVGKRWDNKFNAAILKTTSGGVTGISTLPNELPAKFSLSQNYPNPFNPVTKIKYAIGSRQYTTLKIYDILGNEIATLVDEEKPAGEYEVEFDGSTLTSGIYFYKLNAGQFRQAKKMQVLK